MLGRAWQLPQCQLRARGTTAEHFLDVCLSPGAPKGNKNALKHGRYAAEAIARRREFAELIRAARKLTGAG